MDYDVATSRPGNHAVNIPLAWAMFGGSTFILFLLCYFCQKKLQYNENVPVTTGNETQQRQVFIIPPASLSGRQTLQTTTPPPDYYSVVKKDVLYQPDCSDPPPYEVAVADLPSYKVSPQHPSRM